MYEKQEDIFYYVTVYNENYTHPAMPKGTEEGILKGIYRLNKGSEKLMKKYKGKPIHLLGSGSIMQQVLSAQKTLEEKGIPVNVWSVTSYNLLHKDFIESKKSSQEPYLAKIMKNETGHFIAVSDFMTLLPDSLTHLFPGTFTSLGTDGYGLSEAREELRDYFGISAKSIIDCVLQRLN